MRPRNLPTLLFTTAVASAAVLTGTQGAIAAPESDDAEVRIVKGTFEEEYSLDAAALTYYPTLVPAGAEAGVVSASQSMTGTVTKLAVSGLVPNRAYGAHVHTDRCGPTGADAGPHYQNVPDPNPPSTDPAYANPANEIWLDFTTDSEGSASAVSEVDWVFQDPRPRSVVIHERHTSTGTGVAGEAGERLACVNVNF
ncbi:Cu-Zn family superoxide dismutase [Saccharomonospora amisosensis]|uniref:Cu-Zn family superoxide dismutase n=1 Tax=Saccharomonospora amisosensis TaxID=1128677 RepID=A0A7X5UV33_9PSEU|nr:superoxide dismutase family protein [Saccharomonospora amisosensis]NIJ14826.1 Cu-Zn family superoxide dismutase [Saccharomonospora amisosensis]